MKALTALHLLIIAGVSACKKKFNLLSVMFLTMFSTVAFAGTTGTEFRGLFNLVTGWSEGYLGRTLAVAAFLVGAITGFARSTAMPALIGIVFAVLFAVGPGIITGIASATI